MMLSDELSAKGSSVEHLFHSDVCGGPSVREDNESDMLLGCGKWTLSVFKK